jgi:hypothetical protein
MSDRHYGDDTPSVKEDPALNPPKRRPRRRESAPSVFPAGITLESIVIACGGGWIPPNGSGDFAVKVWTVLLGVAERTVRGYIAKYGLAVREVGGEMCFTPDEFRAKVPAEKWRDRRRKRE